MARRKNEEELNDNDISKEDVDLYVEKYDLPVNIVISVSELQEEIQDNYNFDDLGRFWSDGVELVLVNLLSRKEQVDA